VGATLRLLEPAPGSAVQGELLCCAYTPDGTFVLSGGWDGHLRLWETSQGGHITEVKTGDKPVSACAVSPDGKYLVSGGLDGLLAHWDALTHLRRSVFLAHPRPISGIVFSLDGQSLATSSWDGTVTWWKSLQDRDAKTFTGHKDIVAGCTLAPDGQALLSWSHDTTLRLWDLSRAAQRAEFRGHADKVLSAAVSLDGRWAASGARDGALKLWDIQGSRAVASVNVDDEVVSLLFLRDGETLVAVDRFGRLTVHVLPGLGVIGELATRIPAQAAALAPAGNRIALACGDGRIRFVGVEGLDDAPQLVTVMQRLQRRSTALGRLFGRSKLTYTFSCTCPACRQSLELPSGEIGQTRNCPGCRRLLRVACLAAAGL